MDDILYKVLGVKRDATPDQIKKAYRSKALKYHPDRTAGDKRAAEKFQKITEAYEVLSNPERKQRYDSTGDTSNHSNSQEVVSLLVEVFGQVVADIPLSMVGTINPLNGCKKKLEVMLYDLERNRSQANTQIKLMEKVLSRLTRNGGEDVLSSSFRSKIAIAQDAIVGMDKKVVVVKKALDELKEYSYKCDGVSKSDWQHMPVTGWAKLDYSKGD